MLVLILHASLSIQTVNISDTVLCSKYWDTLTPYHNLKQEGHDGPVTLT